MIFYKGIKILSLARAFFYLWITVEAMFLAFLYYNAYKKFKKTPIIQALQSLLFSIGFFFFYMVFVAITSYVNHEGIDYPVLISLIPLFALPLVLSIRWFRDESTKETKKSVKNYKLKK